MGALRRAWQRIARMWAIAPGWRAVLAMTATSALWSLVSRVFTPLWLRNDFVSGVLLWCGAMLLPLVWKGLGRALAIIAATPLVVLIALSIDKAAAEVGLIVVPMISAGVGFTGQAGRMRVFYPVGLGIVGAAAVTPLALILRSSWIAMIVVPTFWASAAFGDWLASTEWVQRAGRETAAPESEEFTAAPGPPVALLAFQLAIRVLLGLVFGLIGLVSTSWKSLRERAGKLLDRWERKPTWRTAVVTVVIAGVAGPVSTLLSGPFSSALAPIYVALFFIPHLATSARAWIRASMVFAAPFFVGYGAIAWKLVPVPSRDTVFALGLILWLVAFVSGVRRGESGWLRIFANLVGLLIGIVALVGINLLVHSATSSFSGFAILWLPVAAADTWAARRSIPAPPLAPREEDDAPSPLLPADGLHRVAGLVVAFGLLLPCLVLMGRSAARASALPEARWEARPEVIVVPRKQGWRADLAMSSTMITQRQFLLVTGRNPSATTDDLDAPVDFVTWREAVEYCDALSRLEGLDVCYARSDSPGPPCLGYRLPRVGEWVYVAGLGTIADEDVPSFSIPDAEGELRADVRGSPNAWGFRDFHGRFADLVDVSDGGVAHPTYALRASLQKNVSIRGHSQTIEPDERRAAVGFRVVRTLPTP
jgi:sulfatase modifying factor 1